MPKRIVKSPVQVMRDGKLVEPALGSKFDFTSEEVADINKLQPKALGLIVDAEVAPVASPLKGRTQSA